MSDRAEQAHSLPGDDQRLCHLHHSGFAFLTGAIANAPPSGGGAIPLQEYRKEVPPGWQTG